MHQKDSRSTSAARGQAGAAPENGSFVFRNGRSGLLVVAVTLTAISELHSPLLHAHVLVFACFFFMLFVNMCNTITTNCYTTTLHELPLLLNVTRNFYYVINKHDCKTIGKQKF